MTNLTYLNDTYQFQGNATVVETGVNERGSYIVFDETLFYPQGGGQPSDQGSLQAGDLTLRISKVMWEDGVVYHYLDAGVVPFPVGTQVKMMVDSKTRLLHAGAHTAGHLLADVVMRLNPSLLAVKGYHFLNGPYIEFKTEHSNLGDPQEFLHSVNKAILKEIALGAPVETTLIEREKTENGKPFRMVQIGGFSNTPCGGTHLGSLKELKSVVATKVKKAHEGVRVSYTFGI